MYEVDYNSRTPMLAVISVMSLYDAERNLLAIAKFLVAAGWSVIELTVTLCRICSETADERGYLGR